MQSAILHSVRCLTSASIPSIEQLRQRPAVRALEARFGADATVDALRAARRRCATAIARGDATLRRRATRRRAASKRRPRRGSTRGVRAVARAGHQRDRRHHPHQPRPRAARRGGASSASPTVARGYSTLEYDLDARRARPARRPRRSAALPADRRRGGGRRQQQRRGDAARAGGAGGRARGDRVARRAGRDRRRLPRARRDGAVGRGAARGRDDEQDARGRLRRGDQRAHGADPARAPVEFPHRRVHRAAAARGARRRSAANSTCRSSKISAAATRLGLDRRQTRIRPPDCACRGRSRPVAAQRSRPAWTSAASAATSSSAVRRPASSSAARRWSTASARIR